METVPFNDKERKYKHISLVLGGNGIASDHALAARILLSKGDRTEVTVVNSNKTERHILLRDLLDQFASVHEAIEGENKGHVCA